MKCKLIQLCFFLTLSLFARKADGQDLKVSGKVTQNTTGEALASATVGVKGLRRTTQTDKAGNYTISLPATGGSLVVSYTGMAPQEQAITQAGVYNFVLLADAGSTLSDVVVVGYGTQKVTKVSGAISTVKADQIEKLKAVRAEEALQGTVSGVTVIQNGSPGSKPTVLIRGITGFSGNEPLVIVDGVPQSITDLNALNSTDIESLTVLKDAASTAIYGVHGGNGVILVTTKNGRKNQKTQFTLSSTYGMSEVANTIGVLNATEYAAIVNEGSTVSGGPVIFPDL
jgi:TonB-dependent SusC/RagA subfamily outer membrane receptor